MKIKKDTKQWQEKHIWHLLKYREFNWKLNPVNSILRSHISPYNICKLWHNLRHVRGGAENYILQLPNKLDFEGTETLGNLTLNCLLHFPHNFFLMQVSTIKISCIKLYSCLIHHGNVHYTVLHTSVIDSRFTFIVWPLNRNAAAHE